MKEPAIPKNENERLKALEAYNVLDTLPEQVFDDITEIASHICDVPIALVSLIDKDRQWFKSHHGLDATETPRELAFCAHAINDPTEILEVKDSEKDDRFHDNPLVAGAPHVKFYAGAPLITTEGHALGTLCVIDNKPNSLSDKQKTALKALSRQVVSQLELKKINEEIKSEKEKAEAATLAKTEFLSMMSHEIRTPLNAIIGMTYMLLQENPRTDQLENLNVLDFSGKNLLAIVNDVLDYNKIEAGKVLLEKMDFDLKGLLKSIKNSQELRANEKGIALKLYYDEDLPAYFQGDAGRLSQVINNLVSNAVKFTEKGSVKIMVELQKIDKASATIHFEIIDTGIGIEQENIEKIFDQFTQAESNTTRRFGGTGLGLSISKKILSLMNSDIQVSSSPGQGSCFSFSLELTRSMVKAGDVQVPIIGSAGPESLIDLNIKCLVVEDNKANQLVVGKYLKSWGISFEIAENGLEAIDKVQETVFDIILMDIQMPEMNGYDATEKIRALPQPHFQTVPILALTASTMIDVRGKAISIGMNDFVFKPIIPNDLYQKIVKFIQRESVPSLAESAKHPSTTRTTSFEELMEDLSPGDQGFKNELTTLYIEGLSELKLKLCQAIDNKDLDLAEIIVHKTKTTVTMLNVSELDQAIRGGVTYLIDGEGEPSGLKMEVSRVIKEVINDLNELIK